VTHNKYISVPSRSFYGHTVAGGKIVVAIDHLRRYVVPTLCNFLAVILCRMDETDGDCGNIKLLCYGVHMYNWREFERRLVYLWAGGVLRASRPFGEYIALISGLPDVANHCKSDKCFISRDLCVRTGGCSCLRLGLLHLFDIPYRSTHLNVNIIHSVQYK
jgi:hypothetical protein